MVTPNSGHPVACAVALKNIQILRDEQIIENAHNHTMAPLKQKLSTFTDHPLVGDIRCHGFIGALELVKDKASKEKFDDNGRAGATCRDIAAANGLIMRAVGDSMILCPPLIISLSQIDEMMEKIGTSLDQTYTALKSH